MRIFCIACLVRVSVQIGAPGNEVNDFGSGFTAIAKDLEALGREDADIKRNISLEVDTANMLTLEKQHVHERFDKINGEDEHLRSALSRSKRSMHQAEKKYEHALSFIKNKYEAQINAMMPRLQNCGKLRDQIASELNVASAELYMAQEKLSEAREDVNSTKKNWTSLVDNLAHSVDDDEQHISELGEKISRSDSDAKKAIVTIGELHAQEHDLKQVLVNASIRLQAAKVDNKHILERIHKEERKAANLTLQSVQVADITKQLLKKIKDQVQLEHSSAKIASASKNASDVQQAHLQDIIASHKAQISVTYADTDKAAKQLQDATQLLAKDHDVIAQFQNRTMAIRTEQTAICKQEVAKLQDDSGQRVAALKVALDGMRHDQDEVSKQNHQLMTQVEALKQEIAQSMIQFD